MSNRYEAMDVAHLRPEITRLTEQMDNLMERARTMTQEMGGMDSARIAINNAVNTFEDLRYAQGALAAKDDAERVKNASAVLDILKKAEGLVDGQGGRLVAHARDFLRDVMGAK